MIWIRSTAPNAYIMKEIWNEKSTQWVSNLKSWESSNRINGRKWENKIKNPVEYKWLVSKYQVPENCLPNMTSNFTANAINTNKIYVCRYIRKIYIIFIYCIWSVIKIKHIHIDKAYLYNFYISSIPPILYHTISSFHIYDKSIYLIYLVYASYNIICHNIWHIWQTMHFYILLCMCTIYTCVCVLYIHTHFETKVW